MKERIYNSNVNYLLNKIYANLCRLNRNFDVLISLLAKQESALTSARSVSPIIQGFKPQNYCSEQSKKKSKETIKIQRPKFV